MKVTTLEEKFNNLCQKEANFDPELHQTLYQYAKDCDHITEVGVRWVESTFSFLMGKPKTLISIDVDHPSIHTGFNGDENFKLAVQLAEEQGTDYHFIQGNILDINLVETDLLFIDTEHSYLQLKSELYKHADKASKFIILHDTAAHAYVDSTSYGLSHTLKEINAGDYQKSGLKLAIEDFLVYNTKWKIHKIQETGQGLTILERV